MAFSPDSERVRERAYELWERRGRPQGSAERDWLEAEHQLLAEIPALSAAVDESGKESFPASDPPASHLPDKPPVNAEAKFAARRAARETPKLATREAPGG